MLEEKSMINDDSEQVFDKDVSNGELNSEEQEVEVAELSDEAAATDFQAELAEAQEKYLRLAAEFDNYRKRTLREKMDLIQNAGESLLKDVLPVVDDFERGIELASQTEDMDALKTGMTLIYNKLKDFLYNHGIKEIRAINEPFDTDWHEAVTKIPAPSNKMKGKIIDVIQKGYTLNDKVIRYSKVVVGE